MDTKISFCLTATILMMVPIIIIATGPNLAFPQETKKESGMMNNSSIDRSRISQIIPSIIEWIGIGALTITTGVFLLIGNSIILTKNPNKRNGHRVTETKVSMVDKRSTSSLEYKQKTKPVAINKNLLTRYKNLLEGNLNYYLE